MTIRDNMRILYVSVPFSLSFCCCLRESQGAGMIEPHLATMLVYVLTDLDLPKETLKKMLRAAVRKSFNAISVGSLLW